MFRIIPARAGFTLVVATTQDADCGSSPLARGLPSSLPPPKTPIADHPRSRGVYTSALVALFRLFGSSPLARGLPAHCAPYAQDDGIIPARAGFTAADRRRHHRPGDHPRSRGVYADTVRLAMSTHGSSPLARGLRPAPRTRPLGNPDHPRSRGVYGDGRHSGCRATGIIPARAGFTANTLITRSRTKDHPRSRGVYRRGGCPRGSWAGSSPLARGLPQDADGLLQAVRIIPARAGFTWSSESPAPRRWDHPRSRGVYVALAEPTRPVSGSSPLARGLPRGQQIPDRVRGIIPARAGFTPVVVLSQLSRADHPRSRGVYGPERRHLRPELGSSPLARGLPGGDRRGLSVEGIIPARAGFTHDSSSHGARRGDHPRSRGVYS